MITIWTKKFNTRNLMLVTLQSLEYLKLITMLSLPKFNGHVLRATRHVILIWMEIDIVYHTCMFSKGLFTLVCFIIPDFD